MLEIDAPEVSKIKPPRIIVIGIGGAGGNSVNNMIEQNLEGCEFLSVNTDSQALERSKSENIIQLGIETTLGLGAGSDPEIGKKAAEEKPEEIDKFIENANMIFINAGMGGGTGTGASPIIAKQAKDKGILTIAVVTKPFAFEGLRKMKIAEKGITELNKIVDALIVIPNENIYSEIPDGTSFKESFKVLDQVLFQGVRSVTDLITKPGIVNVDFNDLKNVMSKGNAVMGTGEAKGENRAIEAAQKAINNKLLENINIEGATAVLINITGNDDISLMDIRNSANEITKEINENALIIFGASTDESLKDIIRVSIVATGIQNEKTNNVESQNLQQEPQYQTDKFETNNKNENKFDENLETTTIIENDNQTENVQSIIDDDYFLEFCDDDNDYEYEQKNNNLDIQNEELQKKDLFDKQIENNSTDLEQPQKKESFFKKIFSSNKNNDTSSNVSNTEIQETKISSDDSLKCQDDNDIPDFLKKQIN